MTAFLMNPIRWHKGLTLDQFVAGMRTLQEDTIERLSRIRLSAEDKKTFSKLNFPIKIMVLTEDWCGDSLMNLPILAKIVESCPGMEMRIFRSTENPDFRAYYQDIGIRAIPIFSFFDVSFNEIGTWVERPQLAHQLMEVWTSAHPQFEQIRKSTLLTKEERKEQLRPLFKQLADDMISWYDKQGAQQATVKEIRQILGV